MAPISTKGRGISQIRPGQLQARGCHAVFRGFRGWQAACANQSSDKLHLSFDFGSASSNNGNLLGQTIRAPDDGSGSPWEAVQAYTDP